jgi:hypothetical protein
MRWAALPGKGMVRIAVSGGWLDGPTSRLFFIVAPEANPFFVYVGKGRHYSAFVTGV